MVAVDADRLVQVARLSLIHIYLTALEHFIGPPLLQCFMATYALDEATGWQAVNHYRERFRVTGLYENRVFDGVEALLQALVAQGRTLYIATSKPTVFAEEIARHFGFDRYFKRIYGSELDGTRTNKVELLAHLLESEQLAPGSAPVSYTHLDVYKRQAGAWPFPLRACGRPGRVRPVHRDGW